MTPTSPEEAWTEPGIVGANYVVRDAEDVEASNADEVDELTHRERAVAPGRMGVQFREKWRARVPHARIVLSAWAAVG